MTFNYAIDTLKIEEGKILSKIREGNYQGKGMETYFERLEACRASQLLLAAEKIHLERVS